jgi:hypothetical protein
MKPTFNNHTQVLEKLNKLTFIKKDGNSLVSEQGFIFSWEFVFASHIVNEMPIQLVVRIYHEDAYVTSWGCTSREDTFDFVKFIQKTEAKMFEAKYDLQDAKTAQANVLFNNL